MRFIHVASKGSFWWKVGQSSLVIWKVCERTGKKIDKALVDLADLYDISWEELERAKHKGYFQVKPSAVRRAIKDLY